MADAETEDDSVSEETIKNNLELFLDYICDCVDAKELLVHLPCFDREQRKEIFHLSVTRKVEATRRAIQVFRETSEPNKFITFMTAIEDSGYPKVAKILAGKHTPHDQYCRRIVDLFMPELIGRLLPSELLPWLRRYNVLKENETELIRAEEMNYGARRACWLLLYYLPCREKNWFKYFLQTLIKCQLEDLAQKLDEDLYEKLMVQMKDTEENLLPSIEEESLSLLYSELLALDTLEHVQSAQGTVDKVNHSAPGIASLSGDLSLKAKEDKGDQTASEVTKECNRDSQHVSEDFSELNETENMMMELKEPERASKDSDVSAASGGSNDSALKFAKLRTGENTVEEVVEKDTIEDTKENYAKDSDHLEDFSELNIEHLKMKDMSGPAKQDGSTMIKYTREFLLACRNSSLTQYTPKEVAKFPDIQLNRPNKEFGRQNFNRPEGKGKSLTKRINEKQSPDMTRRKEILEENGTDSQQTQVKVMELFDSLLGDTTEVKQVAETASANNFDMEMSNEFEKLLLADLRAENAAQKKQSPDMTRRKEILEENGTDSQQTQVKVMELFDSLLGDTTEVKQVAETASANNFDMEMSNEFEKLLLADLRAENAAQNDLSMDTNAVEYDETEFNIKTDEDTLPETADKDVELRNYQKELAREGSNGENVIIMAPTNSGKTRVACAVMQAHLRQCKRNNKIGRVIFIVENEALAGQQGTVCADQLPAYRTKVISGSVQRDKQQYLKDFMDRRDILVVTAQVLVNALRKKEIESLACFSMIVFDECHHTNASHPYNQIMSKYMDLKLNKNMDMSILPQIIGLTASIGVGGSTDSKKAKMHMKSIMANLDASYLCTVRQNIEELREYENPPIEETVKVKRRETDIFRVAVAQCVNEINKMMAKDPCLAILEERDKFIKMQCQVPGCLGSEQFIQWLSDFKKGIGKVSSEEVRRLLNPCRHHLEVYNKALMIHRDARVKEARAMLHVYMEDQIQHNPVKDETDNKLLTLYRRVQDIDYSNIPENPKLIRLQKLILDVLRRDPNARGIIFVKTRELARALINWTKETPELSPLNASEFVGQVASKAAGGMTKCGQRDILEYFKDGKHKLVIATSVAEEGLDIAKCNLVIRYEHVTNEIVRLQSRGRARAENSKYYVLTEIGSWIAEKEEKNAMLEELMKQLVPIVQQEIEQNQNEWHIEMKNMQKEAKEEERRKEIEKEKKKGFGACKLQCLNCSAFICWSTDVKQIQNAHHVVIDDSVKERIVTTRSPIPMFEESELKYDGTIYCLKCVYDLGGVCEFKSYEFPLLKVKSFRIETDKGMGITKKKWKDVPFYVEKFTLDDLRDIVERILDE